MALVTAKRGSSIPDGSVTFKDGRHVLLNGAGIPVDGNGQATYSTASLLPGRHDIRVVYNGSASFSKGHSSVLTEVVRLHATRLALVITPSRPTDHQQVTLAVTVSRQDGSGTPTGEVVFRDEHHLLVVASLDGNGKASLTAGPFLPGWHSIAASYGGSHADRPSANTSTLLTH
jgi:hypothetical protein